MKAIAALCVVVLGLAVTPFAGSVPSDRYVLWSARTAGAQPVALHVLPADLPADRQNDPAIAVVDRTAGGRVAVAERDDIVIEDWDGSDRTVLPIANVYDGQFSPDGTTLALASLGCDTGALSCLRLTLVGSDGRRARTLQASSARWVDNRRLAYVRDVGADGVGTLILGDPTGRVLRTLGKSYALPHVGPTPSPNERFVADQCRAQVICVRTTTSPERVVARFSGALVTSPLWSPDGSRIALTLAGNYTSKTAVGIVKSSHLDVVSSPTYVHTNDAVIGWSPDSTTVLVQRRCSGAAVCSNQVFSETLSTRSRRRLTHDDLEWEAVRWTKASLTYITPPTA